MLLAPDGTILLARQPDRLFQAASLYKLPVAAAVFAAQRAGRLTFDEGLRIGPWALAETDSLYTAAAAGQSISVATALEVMLTHSSNVGARLLLRRLGSRHINAVSANLGLAQTRLLTYPFGQIVQNAWNQTTPREMARFIWLLTQGRVVDLSASRTILKFLERQTINDRLPARLPARVRVAHKTGELGGARHDVGAIATPAGPLIIAALSQSTWSVREVNSTIATLARTAYDAVLRASPSR